MRSLPEIVKANEKAYPCTSEGLLQACKDHPLQVSITREEYAELMRDKARLDWLEAQAPFLGKCWRWTSGLNSFGMKECVLENKAHWSGGSARGAIDSAMTAEGGGGGEMNDRTNELLEQILAELKLHTEQGERSFAISAKYDRAAEERYNLSLKIAEDNILLNRENFERIKAESEANEKFRASQQTEINTESFTQLALMNVASSADMTIAALRAEIAELKAGKAE